MEAYIKAHEHDLNLIELVVVAVVGAVFLHWRCRRQRLSS